MDFRDTFHKASAVVKTMAEQVYPVRKDAEKRMTKYQMREEIGSLYFHWTHTPSSVNPNRASTGGTYYARISPVPISGAIWLLGSGLIVLVGFRRKCRKS